MVLNRRGVFFSLAALFFVSVLLYAFTSDYTTPSINTAAITVSTTNSYRERLETGYLPLLLRERSYATLYALSIDATARSIPLSLPADYEQAIMTRQYRGNPLSIVTLPEALGNLSNLSGEAGVNVTIVINDITVRQVGAFQALYEANYSYNLSSQDGTVRFNRSVETYGTFFLNGLPDRYYNDLNPWGETLYLYQHRPYAWNAAEFANMSALRYYSTNNDSPSFFGRLTGDLAPSQYGIETTVPQGVTPVDGSTSIDWEYLSGSMYECTYSHPGAYASLRLRFEDLNHYNLTGAILHYGDPDDCPAAP